jgi:hypothetical protein
MAETTVRILVNVTTESPNDIADAIEKLRDLIEPTGNGILEGADDVGNVFYDSAEIESV